MGAPVGGCVLDTDGCSGARVQTGAGGGRAYTRVETRAGVHGQVKNVAEGYVGATAVIHAHGRDVQANCVKRQGCWQVAHWRDTTGNERTLR